MPSAQAIASNSITQVNACWSTAAAELAPETDLNSQGDPGEAAGRPHCLEEIPRLFRRTGGPLSEPARGATGKDVESMPTFLRALR